VSKPFARCSMLLGFLLDGLSEFWRYLQTGEFVVSVLADQRLVFGDVCNPDELGSALLGYIIASKNAPEAPSIPSVSVEHLRGVRSEDFATLLASLSKVSKVTRVTSNPGDKTVFYWVSPSMYQEMIEPPQLP